MEEYSAWVVLKDKWPLFVMVVGVILFLFIVTEIHRRGEKKKKILQAAEESKKSLE
ncbi:MAG: hypothetical protein V2A69_10575 [Pseudomonadota bacterium]